LGYPEKIIDRVVEQTTCPKSTKFFGPEKCPVYIRLPCFGQASERFTHRLSKEIENVYHTIKLRPVFGTRKPLNGTNKDVSPTHKKSNIIYKFSCHCGSGYVGKTSQRFHIRQNQHVPKIIKKWMAGGEKADKSYFCNWQPFAR